MYEIEKGIPLPPVGGGARRIHHYPFARMAVWDSFVVPIPPGKDPHQKQSSIAAVTRKWVLAEGNGWKFATRISKDRTHVRVWRVPTKGIPLGVLLTGAAASVPPASGRVHRLADDEETPAERAGRNLRKRA